MFDGGAIAVYVVLTHTCSLGSLQNTIVLESGHAIFALLDQLVACTQLVSGHPINPDSLIIPIAGGMMCDVVSAHQREFVKLPKMF